MLKPSNVRPWEEVRDQLNRVLRGWAAYFRQGTRLMAYRAVDHHVYMRVRLFLIRRHKVPRRGAGRYPDSEVFGTLGSFIKVHPARSCREEIREAHATTTMLGPCTGTHRKFRTHHNVSQTRLSAIAIYAAGQVYR